MAGAYGRPWLPGHVAHYLKTGERRADPAGAELTDLVITHYEDMLSHYGRMPGIRIARKHLGWYLDGAGISSSLSGLRTTLMTSNDPSEVIHLTETLFSTLDQRSAA